MIHEEAKCPAQQMIPFLGSPPRMEKEVGSFVGFPFIGVVVEDATDGDIPAAAASRQVQ